MADQAENPEPKPAEAPAPAGGNKGQDFQGALDNKAVNKTAEMAQGLFTKMGLKPLESFCCCAPSCCGLRGVVLVLAILQIIYAAVMLLVSLFVSLWAAIAYGSYNRAGGLILMLLVFIFQLVIACLYLVSGIYGVKATFDMQAVINLNPATVKHTQLHYKLNLCAFLIGTTLGLLCTIFGSISARYNPASIVFQWIWFLVYVGLAAYFLFTVWSYSHWITAAAGGDSSALQKAVKLESSAPPPAPPAAPAAAPVEMTTTQV